MQRLLVRATLVAAALAGFAPTAFAHQHSEARGATPDSHAGHQAANRDGAIPPTPYASDAPLRTAMAAIADARAAWRADAPETATALAGTIDDSIAAMIANCRLPPDADATLHGIIGHLARDAAALRKDTAHAGTIASIDAALDDYARAFDPPGFTR